MWCPAMSRPAVKIRQGDLAGVAEASEVEAFRGIPFAQPPVGPLRWRPPVAAEGWSGTRDASSFGASCQQFVRGEGGYAEKVASAFGVEPVVRDFEYSEDCLYLNVFRPAGGGGGLPVMVWIHGGAFRFGTASAYDPTEIVRRGVVVVTVNYRLDVFGFLTHPELTAESAQESSGNYGLLDQIEALRWVQENAAAFGGDPGNVTIFGESAGAQAVTHLMTSPLAAGLFHRAIAQSGFGVHTRMKLDEPGGGMPISAHDMGRMYSQQMGGADISALREIDAATLIAKAGGSPLGTNPIIDGWVLPREVPESFATGSANDVPFLFGSNADEGTALYWGSPMVEVLPPVDTVEKYRTSIEALAGPQSGDLLRLYPAETEEGLLPASYDLLGDSLFVAQGHYVARILASQGKSPYLYFFTQKPGGSAGQTLGAFHASEISYVFGQRFLNLVEDEELSAAMLGAWVQFARAGDPNADGLPRWNPYTADSDEHMQFGSRVGMRPVDRKEKFAVLGAFYDRLRADA